MSCVCEVNLKKIALKLMDFLKYYHLQLEETCRICLTRKIELVPIKEINVENLLCSLSIKILQEDRSHFLCLKCLEEVQKWNNFKEQRENCLPQEYSEKETLLKSSSLESKNQCLNSNLLNSIKQIEEKKINEFHDQSVIVDISDDISKDCENGEEGGIIDISENNSIENSIRKSSRLGTENNQKIYKCGKCVKQFKCAQILNDHMKRHYNARNYACSICDKTFYKQYNVLEHMRIHTGERPFKCEYCFRTFTRALLLRNHIKKIHTNDKKFSCKICTKSFVDNYQLKVHMRTHTGEKPFPCSACERSFALKGQLKSHIKYRHIKQKDFICNICARGFIAKHSLEEHLRTHTGEKREPKHRCSVCGKRCITTTQLKVHIKSQHTGERPFACQLCDKNFVTKSALECHVRVHTGERSFICGECGKAFTTNSSLKIHLRIHTGERPFKCNVCLKNFAQSSTLNTHMKIHRKSKQETWTQSTPKFNFNRPNRVDYPQGIFVRKFKQISRGVKINARHDIFVCSKLKNH